MSDFKFSMNSSKNKSSIIQKNVDLEVPYDEIIDLKPNPRGLYTLCFHCKNRQPPLDDVDEIKELFSAVVPVANVTSYRGLQFVRFVSKEDAIQAWKAFRSVLHIKVADQKKNLSSTFKDKNSNSSTDNSVDDKKPKSHRKPQAPSTKNASNGVMLYMGNIAANSNEQEIKDLMSGINITECKILQKKTKCYAFLKVPNQKEAEKAVEKFHNKRFKSRSIILRVFRAFGPELKCTTDNSVSSSTKETTNSKRGKKSFKLNDSSNNSLNLDDLKAKMPSLEDIDSDDDDDDDDDVHVDDDDDDYSNELDLESAINGNTQQTNLNNYYHLFIGNFPYDTSELNLMKLFQPYQPIKAVVVNGNDRSRSTQGFVCFSNSRDLNNAVMAMDCAEYKNQILLVTSSVCCVNTQKDKNLQCTITAVPGESQYQRKVKVDPRHEKCRLWLKNNQRLNPESFVEQKLHINPQKNN